MESINKIVGEIALNVASSLLQEVAHEIRNRAIYRQQVGERVAADALNEAAASIEDALEIVAARAAASSN